jgi:hypothetical protein
MKGIRGADAGGLEEVVVHEAALLHPRVWTTSARGATESEDACSKMGQWGSGGESRIDCTKAATLYSLATDEADEHCCQHGVVIRASTGTA